jgi:sugar phosphate isomerase/epimerase
MNTAPISKRRFLSWSGQAALGLAALSRVNPETRAGEPFQRPGPSRIRPSLCAYSLRDFFRYQNNGKLNAKPGATLDMFQFIEYCSKEGWDAAEITSYYFPPDFSTAYLAKLKRQAALAGVTVSGASVGSVLTQPPGEGRDRDIAKVKTWLRHASFLGAPYLRVFAGNAGKQQPLDEARKWTLDGLMECAAEGEKLGVMIGMEDHGGIVADAGGVLALIQPAKTEWLGVNLDVGNFGTEDPYEDIRRCAPYAVNCHWKPVFKAYKGSGARPANWPRIVKILREANYHGYLALEYELKEDPHTALPGLLQKTRDALAA